MKIFETEMRILKETSLSFPVYSIFEMRNSIRTVTYPKWFVNERLILEGGSGIFKKKEIILNATGMEYGYSSLVKLNKTFNDAKLTIKSYLIVLVLSRDICWNSFEVFLDLCFSF